MTPSGEQELVAGRAVEVLVAHAHRRGQAVAGAELAARLVDGGDLIGAQMRCTSWSM